jgi:hypothetical protein
MAHGIAGFVKHIAQCQRHSLQVRIQSIAHGSRQRFEHHIFCMR